MLYLVMGFLLTWYILKIFCPEVFVITINSKPLTAIGNFIDRYSFVNAIFRMSTGFLTYWLYLCAVCRMKNLSWRLVLAIIIALLGGTAVEYFFPTLSPYFGILAMIIIPALFKAQMKDMAIVFCSHFMFQWLSLEIRGLSSMMVITYSLAFFIMTLECYFWLLLFYLLFNYYKKENVEQND